MGDLRDRAVAQAIVREAELDLATAHEIFKIVPHTSSMGRHSLTRICVRHIHKMCEREALELKENGELEESEFDLMMWAISRCSTKHALRIPWLVHAPTKHFMLSANLKEAHRAEPELFRRLEKLSQQLDINADQIIFSQLDTMKKSSAKEWGIYIVLEGSVILERGVEETISGAKSSARVVGAEWKARASINTSAGGGSSGFRRPRRMSTIGSMREISALGSGLASPLGSIEASGERGSDDEDGDEHVHEHDDVTVEDVEASDDGECMLFGAFGTTEASGDGGVEMSKPSSSSPSHRVVKRRVSMSSRLLRSPSVNVNKFTSPSLRSSMSPLQRTSALMWRTRGMKKTDTTKLVVRDAHQIDVIKGKGHVIGVLSVLTGKPRYVTAAAFGPVVGCFVSASRLFELFEDPHEGIYFFISLDRLTKYFTICNANN